MRRRRGFTLLELTLALTIAASIGLVVYQAMYTAFRARTSAAAQVGPMREAAVVMDLIEQDFASLVTPGSSTSGIFTLHGPFVGYPLSAGTAEADSVSFCALAHEDAAGTSSGTTFDGVQRVELSLRNDSNGRLTLMRRVQRDLLADVQPDPTEDLLTRSAKSFIVRYYDGYGWLDSWDSTLQEDRLPIAISVTIEFQPQRMRAGAPLEPAYTATRIIQIPCGKPATDSSTGGIQ
ncbi:MAG: type II secretion system protein GspJ [Tepidisphaeraceae bacterium]